MKDNFTSPNPIPRPLVTKNKKRKKSAAPIPLRKLLILFELEARTKYKMGIIVIIKNLSGMIPYSRSAKIIPTKQYVTIITLMIDNKLSP